MKVIDEYEKLKDTMKKKGTKSKKGPLIDPDINLSKSEQQGLKSLLKRIKAGEIVVTQSDKSSRMCVLTPEQYLKSGKVHTDNDLEINWEKVKTLQNQVNSTVWWLSKILNHARDTDEERMQRNIQNNNCELAEMYLLLKDHKKWSADSDSAVPSRPVVSGNDTYNVHLSELLSEILEPVSKEICGAEIASTEDALCEFTQINKWIEAGNDLERLDALQKVSVSETDMAATLLNSGRTERTRVNGGLNGYSSLFLDKNVNNTEEPREEKDLTEKVPENYKSTLDNPDKSLIDLLTSLAMNKKLDSSGLKLDNDLEGICDINSLSDIMENSLSEDTTPDLDMDIADRNYTEDNVNNGPKKEKLTDYWDKIERAAPTEYKDIESLDYMQKWTELKMNKESGLNGMMEQGI